MESENLTQKQILEAQMLKSGEKPNYPEKNEAKLRKLSNVVKFVGYAIMAVSVVVAIIFIGNYSSDMNFYNIDSKYNSSAIPPASPVVPVIITIISGLLFMLSNLVVSAFLNVFCDNAKNLREIAKK